MAYRVEENSVSHIGEIVKVIKLITQWKKLLDGGFCPVLTILISIWFFVYKAHLQSWVRCADLDK